MSIAMVLAEQYVREAEPFPLFDSKSSLECIDDDEDVIKFANAQWRADPRYDSLVSLCPVSTISLAQSPRLSERSCASPPAPVADPMGLGFLTLPVRSARACTTSSSGSTAVESVMLGENSNSGAEVKTKTKTKTKAFADEILSYNRLKRPARWIRSLFA
ncbi:hypothetical protein GGF37_005851 [Kickxella alabastrina]|nr:hypothetical protein GGF37_005851 [Kickxella alabastrina]